MTDKPTAEDELAALLRGPDGARLDDDIATVRNHAPEIWEGTREYVLRVARACELLLVAREQHLADDERARLARSQAGHRVAQAHDEITRAIDVAPTMSRLERARGHLDAALAELRKRRST